MTTKEDIERLDRRIDKNLNNIFYVSITVIGLIFLVFLILIPATQLLENQGTWECVEWEDETYDEYTMTCCWIGSIKTWCNKVVSENPVCSENRYVWFDGNIANFNYDYLRGNISMEVKTHQGDCVWEILGRDPRGKS